MKKIVLIITLLVWHFSAAQDFYVGAKTGLNLSTFNGENISNFDYRTAWHAGLTAELNFSELFSLQLEALYSTQGATMESNEYPADYLAIPVFVKVYPNHSFSIDLGAQVSMLQNDEIKENGISQSIGLEETDISLLAGITYNTDINLFFQARYVMGVSEIYPIGDWKNQVFQFSVGYNFL